MLLSTTVRLLLVEIFFLASVSPAERLFANVWHMDNTTRFELAVKGLKVFTEREGHCRVPAVFVEVVDGHEVPLGAWVGYMRQRYKKQQLSDYRIKMLESVPDWQWGPLSPGPSVNKGRNVQIIEMHKSGKSLRAIADVFELSRQRVHQIVQNKNQ